MKTENNIKVIAADIKTGTVLDQDFQWYIQKSDQTKWVKHFENSALAKEYCERIVDLHPNIEFWIYEGDLEPYRIINDIWNR